MKTSLNIAAVGDLHFTRNSQGSLQPFLAEVSSRADVLLLCGDLTNYGLPEEAHLLAAELGRAIKIPMLAVLGNHDFESGKQEEVRRILVDVGVVVLDGEPVEVEGVGFVGVKGFAGGFGQRMLEPWGEPSLKQLVRDSIDETLKLESGLAKLRTPSRVVLLHYAPIAGTVEGEPLEIYPFLGSSRLEEPLNRYAVNMTFHGHAHRGALEGRTRGGIPVYNVAAPLLRKSFPGQIPFKFVSVGVGGVPASADSAA